MGWKWFRRLRSNFFFFFLALCTSRGTWIRYLSTNGFLNSLYQVWLDIFYFLKVELDGRGDGNIIFKGSSEDELDFFGIKRLFLISLRD